MTLYGSPRVLYGYSRYGDVTDPTLGLASSAFIYDDGYINTSLISFSATFSEPVFDFVSGDISVSGGGSVSSFSGSGTSYTFNVSPGAPGPVTVSVASDISWDGSGNDNVGDSYSFIYDIAAPTCTLTSANVSNGGYSSSSIVSFTATFSETVRLFTSSDLTLSNCTVSNFTGSGSIYTFDITAIALGSVSVLLPSNKVRDLAGNQNTSSNTYNFMLSGPEISGELTDTRPSETWTTAVEFTSDITIPPGAVVTIAPGTVIQTNGFTIVLQDGGILDTQGYRLPEGSDIKVTTIIS